jgi:hypothetical protein
MTTLPRRAGARLNLNLAKQTIPSTFAAVKCLGTEKSFRQKVDF